MAQSKEYAIKAPPLGRGLTALQINLTPATYCTYKYTLLWVMSLYSRGCGASREKICKYLISGLWPCLHENQ